MAIGVSIDLHTGLFLFSLRLGNQECSHMSYIPAPYDSCGMYNISPFTSDRKWESEAFANSVPPFAHRNYSSLQITSPPHSYWAASPGAKQAWGEPKKITSLWSKSVEKEKTLTWSRIGFGSEKASGKQVSSGPHKEKIPEVQVRWGLLGSSWELSHTTRDPKDSVACPTSRADLLGLMWPRHNE